MDVTYDPCVCRGMTAENSGTWADNSGTWRSWLALEQLGVPTLEMLDVSLHARRILKELATRGALCATSNTHICSTVSRSPLTSLQKPRYNLDGMCLLPLVMSRNKIWASTPPYSNSQRLHYCVHLTGDEA